MILRFLAALFHKETPREKILREAFEAAEEHFRKIDQICREQYRKDMERTTFHNRPETK